MMRILNGTGNVTYVFYKTLWSHHQGEYQMECWSSWCCFVVIYSMAICLGTNVSKLIVVASNFFQQSKHSSQLILEIQGLHLNPNRFREISAKLNEHQKISMNWILPGMDWNYHCLLYLTTVKPIGSHLNVVHLIRIKLWQISLEWTFGILFTMPMDVLLEIVLQSMQNSQSY